MAWEHCAPGCVPVWAGLRESKRAVDGADTGGSHREQEDVVHVLLVRLEGQVLLEGAVQHDHLVGLPHC